MNTRMTDLKMWNNIVLVDSNTTDGPMWSVTPQGAEVGVREMEESDLPFVAHMVQMEGWVKSVPMAMAIKSMSPGGALVAVDTEGNVMGFATSCNVGPSDSALLYILVSRDYRKLGVGKVLLEAVERNAGKRVVSLLAFPGAEKFYTDKGYVFIDNMSVVVSFIIPDYNKLKAITKGSYQNVKVVARNSVPLSKLVDYDRKVAGYKRTKYLTQVLFPETDNVMVALDTLSGDVIGYCGAALVGQSLCVAPLYADTDSVAAALFAETVLACREQMNFDAVKVHCPRQVPFLRSMGQLKRQVVLPQMAKGEMSLQLSENVYSYINTCFP